MWIMYFCIGTYKVYIWMEENNYFLKDIRGLTKKFTTEKTSI